MPTSYAYRVRDRQGRMLGGTLEAESEDAVVARLRQLGYMPISIEAEKGAALKTEIRLPGAAGSSSRSWPSSPASSRRCSTRACRCCGR